MTDSWKPSQRLQWQPRRRKKPVQQQQQQQDPAMDAPNLDAMDIKELREFAIVAQMLAQYATMKASAMEDREVGRIDSAMRLENECHQIYQKLPVAARW